MTSLVLNNWAQIIVYSVQCDQGLCCMLTEPLDKCCKIYLLITKALIRLHYEAHINPLRLIALWVNFSADDILKYFSYFIPEIRF